jgi:NADH:ubiquinone reductase (non-electrogenic)
LKAGGGHANSSVEVDLGPKFVYKHMGSMATVGRYKALVDLRQSKVGCCPILHELIQFSSRSGANWVFIFIYLQDSKGVSIAGFASWFIWRSAYLTRVVSWRNRLYVAINWLTTMIFGRDISRI